MSIDDKFERLDRERRLKERVTTEESPKRKQMGKETFLKLNKDIIEDAEESLNTCNDGEFEFIYDKFEPCNACISRYDKTKYLAENYPKRICDNIRKYKQEFYRKSHQKETPPNRVVGWGVYGSFGDSYSSSISDDEKKDEPIEISKENKMNRTVKTESRPVRPSPSRVKTENEVPALDPMEWKDKLNSLEEDIFDIAVLLLGVPKSLAKDDKIDYIIANYKQVRIEAAINHAKKIKP